MYQRGFALICEVLCVTSLAPQVARAGISASGDSCPFIRVESGVLIGFGVNKDPSPVVGRIKLGEALVAFPRLR
jgi:hypothetical protein